MRVTGIRFVQLGGELHFEGDFAEERLARPVDLYPERHAERVHPYLSLPKLGEGRYRVRHTFLYVDTDEGVSGFNGPVPEDLCFLIQREFLPALVGMDPLATERVWDLLFRHSRHGRKGALMQAPSMLDIALWDLKGRWLGQPVYRLLGGPTRDAIPAYASMLGSSHDPERVRERARELVASGYTAMKWFVRYGPADGREGMRRTLDLARLLRETVGDDVDLMFDAWQSWDLGYAREMLDRLADFRPRWVEEPVLPDRLESYAFLRRHSRVPIACGEHEYTRWGFKALLDAEAADVLQPDVAWCGGITETLKICALASAHGIPVIPHGHLVPPTLHLSAAQPPDLTPSLEFLVRFNRSRQHFFREPIEPRNGLVHLPQGPGLGVEIDEDKVLDRRDLHWD